MQYGVQAGLRATESDLGTLIGLQILMDRCKSALIDLGLLTFRGKAVVPDPATLIMRCFIASHIHCDVRQ